MVRPFLLRVLSFGLARFLLHVRRKGSDCLFSYRRKESAWFWGTSLSQLKVSFRTGPVSFLLWPVRLPNHPRKLADLQPASPPTLLSLLRRPPPFRPPFFIPGLMFSSRNPQSFPASPSTPSAPTASSLPSSLLPNTLDSRNEQHGSSQPPLGGSNLRRFSSAAHSPFPSSRNRVVVVETGSGSPSEKEQLQLQLQLQRPFELELVTTADESRRSSSSRPPEGESDFSSKIRERHPTSLAPHSPSQPSSFIPSSTSFQSPFPSQSLLLPIGWSSGAWTSSNPFLEESEEDSRKDPTRRTSPVEFLLIKSAEETRTANVSTFFFPFPFELDLSPLVS